MIPEVKEREKMEALEKMKAEFAEAMKPYRAKYPPPSLDYPESVLHGDENADTEEF